MQYCSKCGRELQRDMNYCPYCGAEQPIRMPQNVQTNQSIVTENNNINEMQNNKIGLSYLLALIFSITLQPVGFIMSLLGYFTAKRTGNHTNKTLAKAGIIISIIEFIMLVIISILVFIGLYIFIQYVQQIPNPY